MGRPASLSALRLMQRNPHAQRAANIGQIMPRSGYAQPFLAYAMGREGRAAEEWDTGQAAEAEALFSQEQAAASAQRDSETAQKILANVLKISEFDPEAASEILNREAEVTPGLEPFKGLSFSGKTKDQVVSWQNAKTGARGFAHLPTVSKVFEAQRAGDAETAERLMESAIVTVSEGEAPQEKGPTPPYMLDKETMGKGGPLVQKFRWNAETKAHDIPFGDAVPKWQPKAPKGGDGGGGEKPRKTSEIVRDIRTAASQIASRLGDQSMTDAIIRATIKDPKILDAMQSRNGKDPYIDELRAVLDYHKAEYQKATGKPWAGLGGGGAPGPAAPSNTGAVRAKLRNDGKVQVGKDEYTPDADGFVTINGRRYRAREINAGVMRRW